MNNFNIAVVQMKAKAFDIDFNTTLAEKLITEAAEQGADIVLFPECFLSSYDMPTVCENLLSFSETEAEPDFRKWLQMIPSDDSPYIKRIQQLCCEKKIGAVITSFTKGTRFPRNSAFVIDKTGEKLMKYSKVHTCDFSEERYLESGDGFFVCDFQGIKLGVMICYDREYPESARELMLQGAEMILVPNDCDCMEPRLRELYVRAMENKCCVVMANTPSPHGGNSCAFTPMVWKTDENDKLVDTCMMLADAEFEGIQYVSFPIDEIRAYCKSEDLGEYRKPKAYKNI